MSKQSLKRKISELEKATGVLPGKYYILQIRVWGLGKHDGVAWLMLDNGSPKGKYIRNLSDAEFDELCEVGEEEFLKRLRV